MPASVRTGGLQGVVGCPVSVEVDLTRGLPAFHLVGLPNTAVRESRERVLAAVRNSGYRLPAGRVTVNLAPADVRKEGSGHDLAIAVAVIAAQRHRAGATGGAADRGLLLGELSLFGEVRPVRGLLAIVLDAASRGERAVAVPADQAWEARLVPDLDVVPVRTLREAVDWYLRGKRPPGGDHAASAGAAAASGVPARARALCPAVAPGVDLTTLARQPLAARAAVLAAAGGHHLLLVGPPGVGKTRLARLLTGLLPDLDAEAGLEVTRIHSAAGLLGSPGLVRRPPLRAPHHTITSAGLLGGGSGLRPGEVTLAHRGLLFLDEFTEFTPRILDALREPLTEGVVRVARATGAREFPARFQLVAAANPCRCGYLGSQVRPCTCSDADRARYLARLSGPLRDRFDLAVELADRAGDPLVGAPAQPAGDADLGRDIERARRLLTGRRPPPAHWSLARRLEALGLRAEAIGVLDQARLPLGLTARGMLRAGRVARTVAALAGRSRVTGGDVREALLYRHEALGCWRAAEG